MVLSTSELRADCRLRPISKSPSQCPGTVLSSTSLGRSSILIIPWILRGENSFPTDRLCRLLWRRLRQFKSSPLIRLAATHTDTKKSLLLKHAWSLTPDSLYKDIVLSAPGIHATLIFYAHTFEAAYPQAVYTSRTCGYSHSVTPDLRLL